MENKVLRVSRVPDRPGFTPVAVEKYAVILDGIEIKDWICADAVIGSVSIGDPQAYETVHGEVDIIERIPVTKFTYLDQHTPGAKLDAGKIRAGLVVGGFSRALESVCEVGTFGAEKYSPDGWLHVENGIERYTDAMYRHLLREECGELNDPESELRHAAHAAWNALARLELMIRDGQNV